MKTQKSKLITGASLAAAALLLGPTLMAQSSGSSHQSSDQSSSTRTGTQRGASSGSSSHGSSSYDANGSSSNSTAAARFGAADATTQTQSLRVANKDEAKWTANKLAGQKVRGQDGNDVGTVKDFLLDAQSGQVRFAVVSTGGFAGVGDKLHLVPFSALQQQNGEDKGFTASVSRQQMDQAPVIKEEQFEENRVSLDATTLRQAAQSFSATQGSANSAMQTADSSSGQLLRATKLDGKDVKANGSKIGTIDGIVIEQGQTAALALFNPEKQIATSDEKFLVPLNRLTFSGNKGSDITTTLTRSDFQSAIRTTASNESVNTSDTASATPTGSTSGFASTDATSGASGSRNVDASQHANATSQRLSQNAGSDATSGAALALTDSGGFAVAGTSSASTASTTQSGTTPTGMSSAGQNPGGAKDLLGEAQAVRHALDADSSVAGEDVRVQPENGKVTLKGTVSSEANKSKIEQIAKQAASSKVQSDLKVQNK